MLEKTEGYDDLNRDLLEELGVIRLLNPLSFLIAGILMIVIPACLISASGAPVPQAEQQRIHNLTVLCTEAASQNYYRGNITAITDENVLAECDDIIVNWKNQCDSVALDQCTHPAYDKYIEDRELLSRIEP